MMGLLNEEISIIMSKTKGAKGGNPNPVQTDEFLDKQFKRQGLVDGALAPKSFSVRLPVDLDKAVRSLPNPTEWVRKAIIAAAEKDGLC
jgi:hypothetical protein